MKIIFLIAAFLAAIADVRAQETKPIQFSLVPDVSLHPRTTRIRGLALDFYGENPQHGRDLGVINDSIGVRKGITWGDARQPCRLADFLRQRGVRTGQRREDKFVGWQDGIVNDVQCTFTGLQTGWFNVAGIFTACNWAA